MKTAHFANQKNKQIVVGTEWGILSVFQRYKNFLPSLSSDKSGGSIHRARALFSSLDASVVVGLLGGFRMTLLSWELGPRGVLRKTAESWPGEA